MYLRSVSTISPCVALSVVEFQTLTYRDIQVGNGLFVLLPGLAILVSAFVYISSSPMKDHHTEEDGIEPRQRTSIIVSEK